MILQFIVSLDIDQETITPEEIQVIINCMLDKIPGGFEIASDEWIIADEISIKLKEKT